MVSGRKRIVTMFGSGTAKEGSEEYILAYDLGRLLAEHGYALCNGGYSGTMEAGARGAKEHGGSTIGVVSETFGLAANKFIDERIVTKTLIERLQRLIELGDGYVALRGGTGTLVELAVAWEYMNKGLLEVKPFVVVGGFWTDVVGTLKKELLSEGRVDASDYVIVVDTPDECVNILHDRFSA